jgi:hypothetical protein
MTDDKAAVPQPRTGAFDPRPGIGAKSLIVTDAWNE